MSNLGLSPLRGLANKAKTGGRQLRPPAATTTASTSPPGETVTIMKADGAGIVTHIWVTIACVSPHHLRKIILRPAGRRDQASIRAPIGDLATGHAKAKNFWSLPLQMSPQGRQGLQLLPMPFASHMKFTVTSEAEDEVQFYYYVDLELHDRLEDDMGLPRPVPPDASGGGRRDRHTSTRRRSSSTAPTPIERQELRHPRRRRARHR